MRTMMNETRAVWTEFHHQFLTGVGEANQRFLSHCQQVGLVANYSTESLGAIGDWFLAELRRQKLRYVGEVPVWWDSSVPFAKRAKAFGQKKVDRFDFSTYTGPFTRGQILLIDEMSSYFAQVLIHNHPGARWVIFVASSRSLRRGQTLLQLGDKKWPVQTLSIVYKQALGALDKEPFVPGWLQNQAIVELARGE